MIKSHLFFGTLKLLNFWELNILKKCFYHNGFDSTNAFKIGQTLNSKNQILKSYFGVPFVKIVFSISRKNGNEGIQGLSFFRKENKKKTILKISGIWPGSRSRDWKSAGIPISSRCRPLLWTTFLLEEIPRDLTNQYFLIWTRWKWSSHGSFKSQSWILIWPSEVWISWNFEMLGACLS